MFFGLFGSRGVDASVTTDMILEDQQQQELERMTQLHLHQRHAAARSYDDQNEIYELGRQKKRLKEELHSAEMNIRQLEREIWDLRQERSNLVLTCIDMSCYRRALEDVVHGLNIHSQVKPLWTARTEQLLRDESYMQVTREQVTACAKKPWRFTNVD